MDVAFLLALLLVSVTGFLLLAFRSTALLGLLLALHLTTVAALFLTAPYGKFAHLVYRFASLLRFAMEERVGVGRDGESYGAATVPFNADIPGH